MRREEGCTTEGQPRTRGDINGRKEARKTEGNHITRQSQKKKNKLEEGKRRQCATITLTPRRSRVCTTPALTLGRGAEPGRMLPKFLQFFQFFARPFSFFLSIVVPCAKGRVGAGVYAIAISLFKLGSPEKRGFWIAKQRDLEGVEVCVTVRVDRERECVCVGQSPKYKYHGRIDRR